MNDQFKDANPAPTEAKEDGTELKFEDEKNSSRSGKSKAGRTSSSKTQIWRRLRPRRAGLSPSSKMKKIQVDPESRSPVKDLEDTLPKRKSVIEVYADDTNKCYKITHSNVRSMTIKGDCGDLDSNFIEPEETVFVNCRDQTAWTSLTQEVGNGKFKVCFQAHHHHHQGFLGQLVSSLRNQNMKLVEKILSTSLKIPYTHIYLFIFQQAMSLKRCSVMNTKKNMFINFDSPSKYQTLLHK